jgi:hypothetical protein
MKLPMQIGSDWAAAVNERVRRFCSYLIDIDISAGLAKGP